METGITEVYELKGSKDGITVRLTLTEEYDSSANSSRLTVAVGVKSSAYYSYTYYLTGSLKVDGREVVSMNSATPTHYVIPITLNTYYRIRGNSGYTDSPWEVADIPHLTDGSKTVKVELTLKGYTTSGNGGSGWSVADSREITLTHIPRASTLGASDAFIGAVSTVSVVRRSPDYSHSVAYRFGELSGWLDADGSIRDEEVLLTQSSIPFTLPERFYQEIPNSPSGVCMLTCRTYLEDAQIGEDQTCTFTVTAKPELCAPLVSGSVTDGNQQTLALTGNDQSLVRYYSTAVCAITAQAQKGAAITEKTVNGVVLEDTLSAEEVQTGSFLFAATDSRGYTGSYTAQLELIPYVLLTANPIARRTDPTSGNAVLTVTGNCYTGSFGAASNTLQLRCRADAGDWITMTPQLGENSYSAQCTLTGLDYRTAHTIQVEATDALAQVNRSLTLGKGIPVFDWGEEDFSFHVPVALPALTVDGQRLEDYIRAIAEGG